MKKIKLFMLILMTMVVSIQSWADSVTYGYLVRSCQHRSFRIADRETNDSIFQARIKLNVNDTDGWAQYIIFLHAWPPVNPSWTQEMEKSAASHGVNLRMIHGYETFYRVDDPSTLIHLDAWTYSVNKGDAEKENAIINEVIDDLVSSKDSSEETQQILGFIFYKFKRYNQGDVAIAKQIVARQPDTAYTSWHGARWPWCKSSGWDSYKIWAYTMMTRVSVSTTPIDTASLSKYGNILLAMGENVDDAIKTNRGTFKLIDDVYKMATQPKKGWQVITTRTLVFSVSVCRGDKSFTTVHVDKTGRNIYENDKDFSVQWNTNLKRWEVSDFDSDDKSKTPRIWYYNEESTTPDPPSATTGEWVAVYRSAQTCGSITSMDVKLVKTLGPLTAAAWYEQSDTYRSKDDDHNEIMCLRKIVEDTTLTWKDCEDCHKAYGRLISMSIDRGGDEGAKAELKWTLKQVADKRIPTSEKMYTGLAVAYQRCYPPQTRNALTYWKLALEKQGQNSKNPTLSENEIVQIYQEMSKCYQLLGDETNMKHYRCLGFGIGCGSGVQAPHKTGVGKSPNQK